MSSINPLPLLRILYLEEDTKLEIQFIRTFSTQLNIRPVQSAEDMLSALLDHYPADAIVIPITDETLEVVKQIRSTPWLRPIPIIFTAPVLSRSLIERTIQLGGQEIFPSDFSRGDLVERLNYFVRKQQLQKLSAAEAAHFEVRIPWWKRGIDLLASGLAILLLSPLLLLVVILIKIDSKGPIIYLSKRVGAGYKVFSLIKFRTMRTGADAMIKDMAAFNMYDKEPAPKASSLIELCEECKLANYKTCQQILFLDRQEVCEKTYLQARHNKAAFMKFGNDPRITRIGRFLRNTSLDELPQLINIFRGDMSLVGNRPLPLYEAEKLTSDEYILRFSGPAGLTGLWQVTKRGKGKQDMSEEERMQLDIIYAQQYSFWMDMKIMFKTVPALFQSENV